jgi:hypothetical protein
MKKIFLTVGLFLSLGGFPSCNGNSIKEAELTDTIPKFNFKANVIFYVAEEFNIKNKKELQLKIDIIERKIDNLISNNDDFEFDKFKKEMYLLLNEKLNLEEELRKCPKPRFSEKEMELYIEWFDKVERLSQQKQNDFLLK